MNVSSFNIKASFFALHLQENRGNTTTNEEETYLSNLNFENKEPVSDVCSKGTVTIEVIFQIISHLSNIAFVTKVFIFCFPSLLEPTLRTKTIVAVSLSCKVIHISVQYFIIIICQGLFLVNRCIGNTSLFNCGTSSHRLICFLIGTKFVEDNFRRCILCRGLFYFLSIYICYSLFNCGKVVLIHSA